MVNAWGKADAMRVNHNKINHVLTSQGFYHEYFASIQIQPECRYWASLGNSQDKLEAQVSDRPLLTGVTAGGSHPKCLMSANNVEGPECAEEVPQEASRGNGRHGLGAI